jgi:hypothetical protein
LYASYNKVHIVWYALRVETSILSWWTIIGKVL